MANRTPGERKEEVRRATDLVEVVTRHLPLRRVGNSWKACCPFHQEKTPSFVVWPESQRWKCFGCGRSGDVFEFLIQKEGMDFREALETLARERGIPLDDREDPAAAAAAREVESAREAAAWACRWFQGNLKGSPAADYLKGRGLEGATALEWRLGFAPPGWDNLLRAAARDGLATAALEGAGLVLRRENREGHYDRFRDRVLFPIEDAQGRVVSFGARALGDEEPKYLNGPETRIFQKGRLLFGLHRARDEALRTRSLAVMEGYMDVIMAHQHGVKAAVAGLGTAFTRDHAAIMRRYADRVALVYDADGAGRRAADRALDILLEEDLDCRVAVLPDGLDPCDLLVARGAAPLRECIEGARDVFDHLLASCAARHDLATVGGGAAAVDEILRAVVRVPNDVKRDLMVRRTSESFRVPEERVRARARQLEGRDAPRGAVPAAFAAPGTSPAAAPAEPFDPGTPEERTLLEAALAGAGLAARLAAAVPPEAFSSRSLARIARAAAETAGPDGTADPAACAAKLEDRVLADEAARLAARGAEVPAAERARGFEDCLSRMAVTRELAQARRRLDDAHRAGREGEEARALEDVHRIQVKRKANPRAAQAKR